MKLSSDRELLAEELYKLTADEYIESVEKLINNIINEYNSNDNKDEKLSKITEISKEIVVYRFIIETIYNMDANISQIEALIKLTKQHKIFNVISNMIDANENNDNNYNKIINKLSNNIINMVDLYKIIMNNKKETD